MGTNYYLMTGHCESCGRADDKHIGKSSGGWCFSLHVYPDEQINTLDDWRRLWVTAPIRNEYGERVPVEEMERIVTERKPWPTASGQDQPAQWYRDNHAAPGPNGFARHAIEPGHCVGHGEGTWDYIVGEFS